MYARRAVLLVLVLAGTTWACSSSGTTDRTGERVVVHDVAGTPATFTASGGGGQPFTTTDPILWQPATTGCPRYRVAAQWTPTRTSRPPLTYLQIRADLSVSDNRFGTIQWTDRGSSLGDAGLAVEPGDAIAVRSPWFDRTSKDPVSITVSMVGALPRALGPFTEEWTLDEVSLECTGRR